jgi:hypothetical protein
MPRGGEVPGGGALMVAVRLPDLVSPGKRPLHAGDRSALAVAGTEKIRTGDVVVFCKIVLVATARVRRDGRDLAMVPWARDWRPASPRSFGQWRQAIGPGPLEGLQAVVLDTSREEHDVRDWRAVVIGRLKAASADGTLIRMPDTPANRAAFGSTGTSDDSAPFPQLRALMLNDASARALLGMPYGPSGGDKAAAEQKLLDTAMDEYPRLFTMDRIWLFDRNFPGAARIARLTARTHVLIRLKATSG